MHSPDPFFFLSVPQVQVPVFQAILGSCICLLVFMRSFTDLSLQDQKLRAALDDYENEKWRIVSTKLGAGFTPAACRDRADELWGDGGNDFVATSSPPEVSAVESTSDLYPQHL